ncbi:MAG: GvpL/GvpF family gas vesicle protein [Thermoanaerobaculia bacterium]
MKPKVVYVYAIGRAADLRRGPETTVAIDGSRDFDLVAEGELAAVCTRVDGDDFSQEEIDRRAGDLDWLGAIGFRHQDVVANLAGCGTIVPLRAFTLFSSEEKLREYLEAHATSLKAILCRLDGKDEWTMRIGFASEEWLHAIESRSATLREIATEMEKAPPGRAFLLKRKLEETKKLAAEEAENALVAEIGNAVPAELADERLLEGRGDRKGSDPQLTLLVKRSQKDRLRALHESLSTRYAKEGVSLTLTGPWPPYSFASGDSDEE